MQWIFRGAFKAINRQEILNLEKSVESRKSAQALDLSGYMKKVLITNKVTTHFFITPSKSIAYTSFSRPTDFSRLKNRLKKILRGLLLLIVVGDINAAELNGPVLNSSVLNSSELNNTELNNAGLSLALYYDEVEEGVEAQHMRYLINDQFLRIDDGSEQADFILFDIDKKIIYSVNHDDQTILKIDNFPWEMPEWKRPEFKFSVSDKLEIVQGAPEVHNKPVYNYQLSADNKVCTQVFLIKDTYVKQMNILYLYQQVLSGQQVATLKNTPLEFHTPCFLTDQVYHGGDYYHLGLPLQITYSRGYVKLLKDFREISVDKKLFVLPEKYKVYKAFSE